MDTIKRHPWFSLIFLVIIIAEMVGLYSQPQVRLVSKGMIMASLLGVYILSAKRQDQTFMLGMIMALLGDAFLLFTTDDFFLIGLGCFLIMQLCYSTTFWKKRRIPRTKDKVIPVLLGLIPIVFLATSWKYLEGMHAAVTLYSIAITGLLITAYLRHSALRGYSMVLIGAVLFVISDLALAIDKFVMPDIAYMPYVVMLAYIAAQYLIVMGVLADDVPKVKKAPGMDGSFGRHKI